MVGFPELGAEPVQMCTTGAEIDHGSYHNDPDVPGFDTPEAAIDDYLARLKLDAELGDLEGNVDPKILAEMRELKAPTRALTLVRTPIESALAVFDAFSSGTGRLDARVIVERQPAGGFAVQTSHVCATALTSDTDRFRELVLQAFEVESDPGPEPAPVTVEPEAEP